MKITAVAPGLPGYFLEDPQEELERFSGKKRMARMLTLKIKNLDQSSVGCKTVLLCFWPLKAGPP